MFTLQFLAGLGLGAFIATLLFVALLMVVIGFQKRTSKKSDEYTDETIRLMKERNDIETRVADHLRDVADWCNANFKS